MKTLLLLALLSAPVLADNCYVHEYGSDSWAQCKEQAAVNDAWWVEHRADQRQLQAETSTAISNDSLVDQQTIILIQLILASQGVK